MNLPAIADVTRLGPRVIRILGQNGPSKFVLQGTNTYLIGSGKRRILLDTAEGGALYLDLLRNVLEQERCGVDLILLSHMHHDHVDGVPGVLKILACASAAVLKLPHSNDAALGVTGAIRDREQFRVEGATLTALHTPGHTDDHLCFYLSEEGTLFSGDCILGGSTSVFSDLATYLVSLRLLLAYAKEEAPEMQIYPAHGEVIQEGRAKISEYIGHRQDREDQILHLLQSGRQMDEMDIVEEMYAQVRQDLWDAARAGIVLHLRKLQKEGKAEPLKCSTQGDHSRGERGLTWRARDRERL